MNHSDQFLRALGTLISDYASLSGCTYAEVCSELKISPQTYSKVWKGQTSNIVYYRDIYAYIRSELSRESQREQMDIQLLRLFANLFWVSQTSSIIGEETKKIDFWQIIRVIREIRVQ